MANEYEEVRDVDDNEFEILDNLQKLLSIMSKKNNNDVVSAIQQIKYPDLSLVVSAIQKMVLKAPEVILPELKMPEIKIPDVNVVSNMDAELKTFFEKLLNKKTDYEMQITERDILGRISKVKIKAI